MKFFKIVTTTPISNAEAIRKAAGDAGAGTLGNYSHTSFSSRGVGRFLPKERAHPAIGSVGAHEEVEEERIEWTCAHDKAQTVVEAIRKAHPYEEPVIDVYPLEII